MALRWRIALTLAPLLLLLAALGTAGAVLLHQLGGRVDAILRENYHSVIYMDRLQEAVERIDSSFQFALAGREAQARKQFDEQWPAYRENLRNEQNNVTLPGERELVDELISLTTLYEQQGQAFYARDASSPERSLDYFGRPGQPGLFDRFQEIKGVSTHIERINQENMEQASADARATAAASLTWFGIALAIAVPLAVLLAWHTIRTILQPIRAVTDSALGISAGNLDQVVPVLTRDELGQLAHAFNLMARHLRDFRRSQSARLLRVQRTSQATIDSFPDPVLVIDAEGNLEMANPAARQLLGVLPRPPEQSAGPPWTPPEPLRQPLADALQGMRDYLPEGFDRVVLLGDFAVLPRIVTIRDPYQNTLGAAVLLQNVTRLRLLDQMKSNLVATASHELKTPLTSIRLAVHLLLEETVGGLNPKQTELLLDARDNCERLLATVNNLLDLARLEQGRQQLDLRPEAPETLLRAAADAARPRAEDKGIDITVEAPPGLPAVAVDPERIGHALNNLLDNALLYTDRGGRVRLSAAAAPDAVTLSVQDSGIGIPPEHQAHVFEKFFRVPGQSRGAGTGLGLAIVHEIVVAHGGSVACASAPGQGTTFLFTLPTANETLIEHSDAPHGLPSPRYSGERGRG